MGKPLKAWRQGQLDIAAWQNDSGQISFTFRKTFKDKATDSFKETKYLWPSDLEALMKLFQDVHAWHIAQQVMPTGPETKADDDDIPF